MTPTNVHIVNAQAVPAQRVLVKIAAESLGTETGLGFTLNYDPATLSNPVVSNAADTQIADLVPNTNQSGKVGLVIVMPIGQTLPAGTLEMATVLFDVAENAPGGKSELAFGDGPVQREVSDANANVVASKFADGYIQILGPSAANVSVSGRVLSAGGYPVSQAALMLTDVNGNTRYAVSSPFGYFEFSGVADGETCTITVNSKRFRFNPVTITASDAIADLEIVAEPPD